MKKRVLALTLIVVMLLTMTAQAVSPRAVTNKPSLTFSGTTANCSVVVRADSTSDEISVTMKLWIGSRCIAIWSDSGNGYVYISKTADAASGVTYTLTADVTINGVARPQVSVSERCP